MRKKRKLKKVNPVAKALATPNCKPRVVHDRTKYSRKEKHKGRTDESKTSRPLWTIRGEETQLAESKGSRGNE